MHDYTNVFKKVNMDISWVIAEQTKIKHEVLRRYMSPWMNILYRQQENKLGISRPLLIYFDGFAGPGKYYEDKSKTTTCPGSPLIVGHLANAKIKEKTARRFQIICCDADSKCVEMLQGELQAINRFDQLWHVEKIEFEKGVHGLLDSIQTKYAVEANRMFPMFFFIDPFGYSGYSHSTLERILKFPMVELLVNFMIYDVVRFCEDGSKKAIMQTLFGTDEFLRVSEFNNPTEKQSFLMNLYCRQLRSIGADFVLPFRVNTPGTMERPRYYMIHCSTHAKAFRLMKDNMARISEVPYKFEAIGVHKYQIQLFDNPEIILRTNLKDYCKSFYPNSVEFGKLEDWAYANTSGVSKTIKAELMYLEKVNGLLKINRPPKSRKNTVTSGALIRYIQG